MESRNEDVAQARQMIPAAVRRASAPPLRPSCILGCETSSGLVRASALAGTLASSLARGSARQGLGVVGGAGSLAARLLPCSLQHTPHGHQLIDSTTAPETTCWRQSMGEASCYSRV